MVAICREGRREFDEAFFIFYRAMKRKTGRREQGGAQAAFREQKGGGGGLMGCDVSVLSRQGAGSCGSRGRTAVLEYSSRNTALFFCCNTKKKKRHPI